MQLMWSITTNCIMQYDKILSFLVGGYFLQVCELFYLPLKGFCILSAYSWLFSFLVQWHLQICPKNHPKTPMKMWCRRRLEQSVFGHLIFLCFWFMVLTFDTLHIYLSLWRTIHPSTSPSFGEIIAMQLDYIN